MESKESLRFRTNIHPWGMLIKVPRTYQEGNIPKKGFAPR